MHRSLIAAAALAATALGATPALAQGHGHGHSRGPSHVPPGQMPPAGMCRVWVDGLPPGQQPRPTSCAYAYSHVPPGGRVLDARSNDRRVYRTNDPRYDSRVYGSRTQNANGNYVQRVLQGTAGQRQTTDGRVYRDANGNYVQRVLQGTAGQTQDNRVYRSTDPRVIQRRDADDDDGNDQGEHEGHGNGRGHGHGHGHGKHGD